MSRKPRSSQPAAVPARRRGLVRSLPRKLRNYTVLTFSIGAIIFVANVILFASDPNLNWAIVGLVFLLFVTVGFTRKVKVRRGSSFVFYQFWEYPAIVGLVLAPPYVVALVMTVVQVGILAKVFYERPQQRSHVPLVVGTASIAASIGAYVGAIAPPVTYIVGYVLMAMTFELLMLGLDLTRDDREYAFRAFRTDLHKRLFIPFSVAVVVTAMVVTLGPHREFLLVAPLTLLVLYWTFEWRTNVADEQAAWRHMESISAKFIGELEEHKAISVALEESLQLFAAVKAQIVLPGTATEAGSIWTLEQGQNKGVEVDFLPGDVDAPPPEADESSQVIPLTVGERNFGYMVITWSSNAPDMMPRKGLTNTFGHAVAASIANTRHNKHISNQAAEKAREAERDPLTGLGNRSMLSERGPSLLAESAEIGRLCALLLLDLDGFKRINDTLGHAAGDRVLAEIAQRLKDTTRKSDLAIRLGGDEFAILAVDMESPADAERLASKITRALIPPVEVEDLHLSVESSIGVAIYPDDAKDVESLLRLADIAMYGAKNIGRGKMLRYSPGINFNTTEALFLATDLRNAIFSATELVLHYQPQINLSTGETVGVEALVRWNHPKLGMLGPDRFVHIAERSNLIRPFTLKVLEMAVADRARMRECLPHATVSVNLSAQNLLDTGLAIDVKNLLERYGIAPEELVLEVTETTTAKDVMAADRVLNDLAHLGCQIAMDDFGSGYATMDSMRSGSPITEIKIDRGFISNIFTLPRDYRVAAAIMEIAHAWDCRVVAEGVENRETYEALKAMDCDVAQGYWMHKPAPLDEIMEWATNGGMEEILHPKD